MRAIEVCRTEVLGGHVDVCDTCGLARPAYNSCRNRHCPKCQALTQAMWIEKRMERVLPTHSFHIVFTLPHELGPMARRNRRAIFDLLFSSASRTLLELGRDERHLGALLGVTAVLHTWSRDLRFHPHLHCVVTGGGLATEGDRWISSRQKYLFPVRVLSDLFRGKFISALNRARGPWNVRPARDGAPREAAHAPRRSVRRCSGRSADRRRRAEAAHRDAGGPPPRPLPQDATLAVDVEGARGAEPERRRADRVRLDRERQPAQALRRDIGPAGDLVTVLHP